MRKIINSETRKYEENITDTLVLDAVPTVNSFNTVTSDGVARAIAGASGEVPQVTESDNGKVLMAVYDAGGPAVEWGTGPTVDQTYDAESTNAQSGVAVASAIGSVNAVPASDVEDAGKVLTVDASGDAGWETLSIPTVDQTYDGTSANAQSGTAVAEAIGTVNAVPASTSVDEGKVLTVDNAGSAAWATPAVPTVDQTYDATSANAQSGVAVAGALAEVNQVPSSTSSDGGKVLTVDAQGVPGWATPAAPGGGSGEWWGGDPGGITNMGISVLPTRTVRLRFKDLSYDPRNDPDATFIAKFDSITKVSDGVYDFVYKGAESFKNKYLTDNEFVILFYNCSGRQTSSSFYGCTGLKAVYNISCDDSNVVHSSMFYGCVNLVEVRAGVTGVSINYDYAFKTTGSCGDMFRNCTSLKRVLMQVKQAYLVDGICQNCYSLEEGPMFVGVGSCASAFYGCLNLENFTPIKPMDTWNYTAIDRNCSNMFSYCPLLTDLGAFSYFFLTTKISNARYMFSQCHSLQSVPYMFMSSSGVNCYGMFDYCLSLAQVPQLDWGAVTNAGGMFKYCTSLCSLNDKPSGTQWYSGTLNASLTNTSDMFNGCYGIQEHLLDCYTGLSANAGITTTSNCFKGCGTAFSNPDLALIPSSWGGTGT